MLLWMCKQSRHAGEYFLVCRAGLRRPALAARSKPNFYARLHPLGGREINRYTLFTAHVTLIRERIKQSHV
jgi:hypothetical protein